MRETGTNAPPSASAPSEVPLDCRRAGIIIEKDLAGAATPEEKGFLSEHVASCPDCREYLPQAEFLARVFTGARLRYSEAPAAAGVRPSRGFPWKVLLPVAAAASLLAVSAGWFLAGRTVPQASPPSGESVIAEKTGLGLAVPPASVPVATASEGFGTVSPSRAETGLFVAAVIPESWADRAGLRPGDRIVEASGIRLSGREGRWALDYMLRHLPPGGGIDMTILRDGNLLRVVYREGER